jgi:hypothetical protein
MKFHFFHDWTKWKIELRYDLVFGGPLLFNKRTCMECGKEEFKKHDQ